MAFSKDDDLFLGYQIILDDVLCDSIVRNEYQVGMPYSPSCGVVHPMELEPGIAMIPVGEIAEIFHLDYLPAIGVPVLFDFCFHLGQN